MTSNNAERRQRIKEQSKEVANYLNKQPSDELIQQWMDEFYGGTGAFASTEETFMAKRAAEWGADQELEACIKLLSDLGGDGEMIRRYRRPKPPSLKEQAKFGQQCCVNQTKPDRLLSFNNTCTPSATHWSNSMTDNNRPITPPPELYAEWLAEAKRLHTNESLGFISGQIAQFAYRAGADMELEACINEIYRGVGLRLIDYSSHRELLCSDLCAARRPKPPSLKQQALAELELLRGDANTHGLGFDAPAIRRALEFLPD